VNDANDAADRQFALAVLLEELQHRISNSLQIIASIILLKARAVQSEETRLHLQDTHKRVMSIAAVQKHLHASGVGGPVEIAPYLSGLCEALATSMIDSERPISLNVVGAGGTATSRQAEGLGLIVTELVMNALKHAFPDKEACVPRQKEPPTNVGGSAQIDRHRGSGALTRPISSSL
jgi:two-component sensor histidine kinase